MVLMLFQLFVIQWLKLLRSIRVLGMFLSSVLYVGCFPSSQTQNDSTLPDTTNQSSAFLGDYFQTYTIEEDHVLSINLPDQVDGNQVERYELIRSVQHGQLSLSDARILTYRPNSNFHGFDDFIVQAVFLDTFKDLNMRVSVTPLDDELETHLVFPPTPVVTSEQQSMRVYGQTYDVDAFDDILTSTIRKASQVQVNGQAVETSDNFISWFIDVDLALGINTFKVEAFNDQGKVVATDTLSVRRHTFPQSMDKFSVNPVQKLGFILDSQERSLFKMDLESGYVNTLLVDAALSLENPIDLQVDSSQDRMLILDIGLQALIAINYHTGASQILASFSGLSKNSSFAFHMPTQQAFILDRNAKTVRVLSLLTGGEEFVIRGLKDPLAIALTEFDSRLFILEQQTDSLLSLSLTLRDQQYNETQMPVCEGALAHNNTMCRVQGVRGSKILVDDLSKRLYIVNTNERFISVFNTQNQVLDTDFAGVNSLPWKTLKHINFDRQNQRFILLMADQTPMAVELASFNASPIQEDYPAVLGLQEIGGIAWDADKHRLVLSDKEEAAIRALNVRNGKMDTITDAALPGPLSSAFHSLVLLPSTDSLIIADNEQMTLLKVAMGSGERRVLSSPSLRTTEVREYTSLVFDPIGQRVIALDQYEKRLMSIDPNSGEHSNIFLDTTSILPVPVVMAMDTYENRILIGDDDLDVIAQLNLKNKNLQRLLSTTSRQTPLVLEKPLALAFDSVNQQVFVMDAVRQSIFQIDTVNLTWQRLDIDFSGFTGYVIDVLPQGVVLDEENQQLYIVDRGTGRILCVHIESKQWVFLM